MAGQYTGTLSALTWRRLKVNLLNIRTSPAMKAHHFTIIESILKGVSESFGPDFIYIHHIKNKKHTFRLRANEKIPLEIMFFRSDRDTLEDWKGKFTSYLADPLSGKNFDILEIGDIEERSYEKIIEETGGIDSTGEICLEFLTPLPFKPEKQKRRTHISKGQFINCFTKRFSRLFGDEIHYDGAHDNFTVLPCYWNYTEIRHSSSSQPGHVQLIRGCFGKIYIKGDFKGFLPFLSLGSEIHTGAKLSNSQGCYILHKEPQGYFTPHFPRKEAIAKTIRDVLDRYDNAVEALSRYAGKPFEGEAFAEDIIRDIVTDGYKPEPNTAFLIKKKSGVDRLVEQISMRDLIVQQYILKTINPVFERIFEEGSIGFRKGISRHNCIEMVRAAIAEGYQYVIESDIEDFFPSVDTGILKDLLDHYVPEQDRIIKELIMKFINNGYILKGKFHERVRGLAQGSPLSPVLANLYLDSFDEQAKHWNVKMIRYADDLVILAKTKEEAENVLSRAESYLSGIMLKIKKEKTAIRHIDQGFQFLGIRFEKAEVKIEPEEELRRLKQPLYVTEPYVFLSLNGDAIDVKKDKAVIDTIPFRRISEIMVMEKTVFSTALLRKCTENNVPLTLTLNTGYFITTVKPDSKNYFLISAEHARKYSLLSETDILGFAKEIAANKLDAFITFFRQRYVKDMNMFLGELERAVNNIHCAGGIDEVRGHEGFATRRIYKEMNRHINNETFHMKSRQRKNPDPINSLLNFGSYLLFSKINATVRAVGLNPYLGFLHSPEDNFESLVCDLQELFRARIMRMIIRMINLKSITEEDFEKVDRGHFLKRNNGAKKFVDQFEKEMVTKGENSRLSLKESIYLQTLSLKKYVLEDKPLSFEFWRS